MKFRVFRTSDWSREEETYVEINTIEELVEFRKKSSSCIILDYDILGNGKEFSIEIYDDWRE